MMMNDKKYCDYDQNYDYDNDNKYAATTNTVV